MGKKDRDSQGRKNLFRGVSYFEWDVRTDKGGTEEEFGMWGEGDYTLKTMDFGEAGKYNVKCTKAAESKEGNLLADAVQDAYGGEPIDHAALCRAHGRFVTLNEEGFKKIQDLTDKKEMAVFIKRIVEHTGGIVTEQEGLDMFAEEYAEEGWLSNGFGDMMAFLGGHLAEWAEWSPYARCIVDRQASAATIGNAFGYVCGQGLEACATIPQKCKSSLVEQGDYLFGQWYAQPSASDPLRDCNFGGAAQYTHPTIFKQYANKDENENIKCVDTHDKKDDGWWADCPSCSSFSEKEQCFASNAKKTCCYWSPSKGSCNKVARDVTLV